MSRSRTLLPRTLLLLLLAGCEWIRLPVDGTLNDLDEDGYDSSVDCDDFNDKAYPFAEESCNGVDNNCSGSEDDASDAELYYADADGDGYGDAGNWVAACDEPIGYTENPWDCDDADDDVNPSAIEDDCADPADYNCDGIPGSWDGDLDGWPGCEDCDDSNATVWPGAEETCNATDDDCDGVADEDLTGTTWYLDADGDGWGDAASTVEACDRPDGYVADATDCDDTDPDLHPDAPERCDGDDDDCDGEIDEPDRFGNSLWYADADEDGFGDENSTVASCDGVSGYVSFAGDCDDADATVNPTGTEVCDSVDQNCDGVVDENSADAPTWYADADGDGWGDEAEARAFCIQPPSYVAEPGDCDDTDSETSPDGTELCGGADEDCDGETDEDGAADADTWYADVDGDGWGDDDDTVAACTEPADRIAIGGDCDDADVSFNPDALEIDCSDPADYNCDGSAGLDDGDLDGWYACEDCDDTDPDRSPAADETCNEVDDDCDGETDEDATDADTFYADDDRDTYGDPDDSVAACERPTGYIVLAGDCDDTDAAVSPAETETCATAADDDCDGDTNTGASDCVDWYADADEDGYGDTDSACLCEAEAPYTADNDLDCADDAPTVNPDGTEECANGYDDDCDGVAVGCGLAGEIALASAEAKLVGTAADDAFGTALGAADLDGDGRADVLVGASGADTAGADAGDVYLFEGALPASGGPSTADATWSGAAAGDATGRAITAGDLDGDGTVDLVFGAAGDDGGGADAGAAYIFFGPVASAGLGSADARLTGADASDCAGCALAVLDDFDGDGDGELVVAAYRESVESGGAGAVYVLDTVASGTAGLGTGGALLVGGAASDFFGRSVASAGDVDGDGLGDLVVGAYGDDTAGANAGAAYVYFGPLSGDIGVADADASLIGEERSDNAGFVVAAGGDADADGYSDIWVGAFNNDTAGSASGALYLARGPLTGSATLGSDATLYGEGAGDGAGVAIAADDFDGDGFGDVATTGDGVTHGNTGVVWVAYGPFSGATSLSSASGILVGEDSTDDVGGALLAPGDTDGDGYPDLLVGASAEDSAGSNAGAVYLLVGGPGI